MNRQRLMVISSFFLIVAAIAVGIVAINQGNSISASAALPIPTRIEHHDRYARTSSAIQGIPAISPRSSMSKSIPTFTSTDVVAYISQAGFASGHLVKGAHLVIDKIAFITSKQASILLQGEFIGLPDNAIVCYVELTGPFLMDNMASLPPGAKIPTVQKGVEVFDAKTGNLLISGNN